MNYTKIYGLLFLIFNILNGMETSHEQGLKDFEQLPQDVQREILKYRVREALHAHIKNAQEITQIIKLTNLIKLIEADKASGTATDCKLLTSCALVDKNFLQIARSLIPQILKEKETRELIDLQLPALILKYVKAQGLKVITSSGASRKIMNYRITYNLSHLGASVFPYAEKNVFAQDFSDDSIFNDHYKFINTFLLKLHLINNDPIALDIVKHNFGKKLYIDYKDALYINEVAVYSNNDAILELMRTHLEEIKKQPNEWEAVEEYSGV